MIDDRPMTVPEAATYLQLSTETIRRMLRDGRLRGSQPAGRRGGWRVRRHELDRLAAPGTDVGNADSRGAAPRLPKPTLGPERQAVLVANLLDQAERARARGDAEGVAQFERMAAHAVASNDRVD